MDDEYRELVRRRLAERNEAYRAAQTRRVDVLARMLAGMRWPGQGGWDALNKKQQAAAKRAARRAIIDVYSPD